MPRTVTFKGTPLTLVGRPLWPDTPAPDFRVTSRELKEIRLSDFEGRIKIITSFPSLDTPVCDTQVREFNKRAEDMTDGVVILGISKDLPFAQARFCGAFGIDKIQVLSDYKTSSFGINYGLLIKELNLLARAVVIVDSNDVIRYVQVVGEVTTPPDYGEVLDRLDEVVKNPDAGIKKEHPSSCEPCRTGMAPLSPERIDASVGMLKGWHVVEGKKIVKELKFKDFSGAKYFVDLVSAMAEDQGHHPGLGLNYNKLKIALTTHAAGGLTENDFVMARIIDELGEE